MFKQRLQNGTSLMEVLICLLLLTGGFFALAKLHTQSIIDSGLAKQRMQALALVQSKLEALRTFQVIPTTPGKTTYQDIVSSASAETINTDNTTFSRSWTVNTFTDPDYKVITVTVTWNAANGIAQSIALSSVIAGIDPANAGKLI